MRSAVITIMTSKPNRYVLAIDLGSGGPKVGVVDEQGNILASAAERTRTLFLPGGGAEQDPNEWWQAVSTAAKKAIHASLASSESIQAVSCTTQWSVIVPVDQNGEALMNAVHWLDTRGAPYNQQVTRGFPSVEGYGLVKLIKWVQRSGFPPTLSGIDALGHILFIKSERPEIYARTDKFLEPMDYLNLRLTGRAAGTLCTVYPMLLTDIRKPDLRQYDPWALRTSGVDPAKLPELLPVDGVVGQVLPSVAQEWGISPQAQVFCSANDNNTSAIGSGAVADYESVAILGTSGYLAGHVPYKKTDIFNTLATIPSPLPGKYLIMAETGNTGKNLEAFLSNWVYPEDFLSLGGMPPDAFERFNAAAGSTPPGSRGLLYLPWLNGSLSPKMDYRVRGGFLNLSYQTERAQMARAVLEGVSYNWRWLVEAVQKFTGRGFTSLRLGGGGAQSEVWAQIMADVLGIPMHQLDEPRLVNVRGAAFLALDRLGWLPLPESPSRVKINHIFEPRPEHRDVYNRSYAQFRASYQRINPIFHALNPA
jgi:xylulokinase